MGAEQDPYRSGAAEDLPGAVHDLVRDGDGELAGREGLELPAHACHGLGEAVRVGAEGHAHAHAILQSLAGRAHIVRRGGRQDLSERRRARIAAVVHVRAEAVTVDCAGDCLVGVVVVGEAARAAAVVCVSAERRAPAEARVCLVALCTRGALAGGAAASSLYWRGGQRGATGERMRSDDLGLRR